jgi:hypothetical protein
LTTKVFGRSNDADRLPTLPSHLREALAAIEPSVDGELRYYPCRVRLTTGEWQDHVYVQEARSYIQYWGVWPWEDEAKRYVDIRNVEALEESPSRLPVALANKMYEAGESAMGGCLFGLILRDGTKLLCETGNAVDFINWPPGIGPADIVDLIPHEGRLARHRIHSPEYAWCLYR